MISSINSSQLASQFFSRLDSKNQGYIEQSDFSSAISQVSQNTDSDEISALFKTFDSDSDGKVTESEFTSRLGQLLSQLEEQAGQSRMHGGMPPPGGPQGMGGMPTPMATVRSAFRRRWRSNSHRRRATAAAVPKPIAMPHMTTAMPA